QSERAHCGGIYRGKRSGAGGAKGGAKGNAHQQSTHWTQSQARVSQALDCRHTPEVGAVCGKAARTVLCGGRDENRVPTATAPRVHHVPRRRGGLAARGARAAVERPTSSARADLPCQQNRKGRSSCKLCRFSEQKFTGLRKAVMPTRRDFLIG